MLAVFFFLLTPLFSKAIFEEEMGFLFAELSYDLHCRYERGVPAGGMAVWRSKMGAKILAFLRAGAPWVRYLYFLRFSLLLWLFAPALCAMNWRDSTLTSGIVTPETWQQYFCVGFFVVSATFAALVIARVVVINGPARWDQGYNENNDARPPLLTTLLDNDLGHWELTTLVVSQIPTGLVFLYFVINGMTQHVKSQIIWPGFLVGATLAGSLWWLANAWYYLRYVAPPHPAPLAAFTLGGNAARTVLYPRWCFRLNPVGAPLPGRPTIEQAQTILPRMDFGVLGEWLAHEPGFGTVEGGHHYLFEAHAFATIAMVMFSLLFLVIWPLTAPVPTPLWSWIMIGVLFVVAIAVMTVFWTARPAVGGRLTVIQILLTLGILWFLGVVVWLYTGPWPERFPIFATILILMTSVCYALGGIAFFFDRFRVPVLTLIVVAMIAPRLFHLDRIVFWDREWHVAGQEEHYLSTTSYTGPAAPVKTPAEILASRFESGGQQPLIIVTATGGGLHASAWTAAVLAHLESKLGSSFHQHLLMMSTVSGGSVGLMSYLRELHEGTLDSNPALARARMQSVAQCSSLEGAGWGLIYYDLPKAFVPVIPYLVSPSPGDNDLDTQSAWSTPLLKDRTWSLRKAFQRNLNNSYCSWLWVRDGNPDPGFPKKFEKDPRDGNSLTLRQLSPSGEPSSEFPAFTMNTTTVEHGERFLLANNKLPDLQLNAEPDYRARSFLATFWSFSGKTSAAPDLPLATAAQMSATFPYVSSAARVPLVIDKQIDSVHFVDGGYYDNDGTASVIEFLRYGLALSANGTDAANLSNADQTAKIDKDHPLRILLIEIRNSGDIAPTGPETSGDESGSKYPWNALSQLTGPLLAFWQAGHESVTGRNRNALGLLEQAMADKLEIHRIVYADANSLKKAGTDPLNWSLTPIQREEVQSSVKALTVQDQETTCWFNEWGQMWTNAQKASPGPIDATRCLVQ